MGIIYILTLIILGIAFMMFKKSDEKLNFIKWLIIYIVSLFGYNIILGIILGLLNITSHIWLLSIINLIFAGLLGYKAVRYKIIQKYFVRKLDVAAFVIILLIFTTMFVKDLYIYNGDITHFAVDSAIHYRAAKHYSDNLKLFINVEDKTFFDFNVMQPGAYINDGIFMNVINSITGIDYCYLYQTFETIVLFLSGFAFYAAFADKIKTKRGLIGSLVLFALYIYGYPYNSWIFGFSYLSVGIMMIAMLIPVVDALYSKENITRKLIIPLIIILATGLIFSYCLFVPAIFAAICIYCFLKDFTVEGKTYLKIFKKTTLIVTGLLLLVTVVGIGYLVIPTFFIEGQTDLVTALKVDGAIYSERYRNFIPFIPFAIMYFVEIIKRIKNKQLRYMDVFAIVMMGFFACLCLGLLSGKVSLYYMFKVYFIIWMVVFIVTIDLVNEYIDERFFRLDIIALILLFVYLYVWRTVDINKIIKLYLFILLIFYMVLPELIKKLDFSKIKFSSKKFCKLNLLLEKVKKINVKGICVSGYIYVTIWALFVCGWVWIKAGHVIGEEEKHSLPNLVGIYYSENCENRKLIDLTQNFNKNEIELILFARENLNDLDADNIELITGGYYYCRIWATAMLEITTDSMPYQNFIQDNTLYTVEDALNDESKKYIVKLVSNDQTELDKYNEELKETKQLNEVEILFENENGFVAKIKNR